jgi:hypothetical protein
MLKLTAMEKSNLSTEKLKKLLETPPKKTEKPRSYKYKKTPRVPVCIGELPIKNTTAKKRLGKAKIILQKGPKAPFEQLSCTANQNYPLFFIEKAEELLLKKVEKYKVKERLIALQNIRRLANQMQQCINTQILAQVQKEKSDFYELLKQREERHFRIDRIIRYLAEP